MEKYASWTWGHGCPCLCQLGKKLAQSANEIQCKIPYVKQQQCNTVYSKIFELHKHNVEDQVDHQLQTRLYDPSDETA